MVYNFACHPYVTENAGRVALMRGPLLYCLEGADHPGCDLRDSIFIGAFLQEVDFSGSDLTGSDFTRAKLNGVKAEKATGYPRTAR